MATLPTADDLGARPTPQSRRQLSVVGNAGALGEALTAAGVTMKDVGAHIEEVRDEDDVRRLDVEHARRAREIRQAVREARGLNAQDARRQAEADLATLDQDILNRARSNTSRRALEAMVARRTSLERDSIVEYARTETNTALETSMTARIDNSLDEAEELWDRPDEMERSLTTALTEIDNRGRWRGADPAIIANERAQAVSRVRANRVAQLVQIEDYDGAAAYLEAHRGEIEADQEGNLRRLVNGGLRDLEDDRTAAWAIGASGPDAAPAPSVHAPVVPGNIDTSNIAPVRNADGSVSTVRTISIGTDEGEVLIPTVINGRVVSDEEAEAEYRRTGRHLGVFRNAADATAYAQALHQSEDQRVAPQPRATRGNARDDFKRRVRRSESGGNDRAVNPQPGQTASGRYQFTRETFVTMHRRVFGGNMTDAQRWALRFDAGVQERLMDASIDQYQRTLRSGGQQATPGNLYLSHFFGPETAVRILQNPGASLASLLGSNAEQIFRANPNLRRNMTGADAVALTNRAMGGSAAAPASGSPAPDGTTIDLERAYARIEALNLTPSAKLRARNRVRELAAQNDVVRNRERSAADEELTRALTQITASGGRLTNINQLPAGVLARASPNTVLQIQEMIRANNQPREPEANSPLMANLVNMASNDPNAFLRTVNPELYRGRVTDGEVMSLHTMRNTITNRDGAQPSEILGMINFVLPETGLVPTNARDQRQGRGAARETEAQARDRIADSVRTRIFAGVQERLSRNFPRGTQPTQQDILDAVRAETMTITINGERMRYFEARERPGGVREERIIIPTRSLPAIDAVLRASGRPVNGPNRINEYLLHKTRYDAR